MKRVLYIVLFFLVIKNAVAQSVAINTTGAVANNSALLDVSSISKGLLIPRMTAAEKTAIVTPATSLLIYQTDNPQGFYYYDGAAWVQLGLASGDYWTSANGLDIYNTNSRYVGIGTFAPLARLHIIDSSVLFSAAGDVLSSPGNVPVSGPGRRMMWYADKAAFRAGYVNGNTWDQSAIGNYSFASGKNTRAAAAYSIAVGDSSKAVGLYAMAGGLKSEANGFASFAFGDSSRATVNHSTAIGYRNVASGSYSVALGGGNIASAWGATALGFANTAGGNESFAVGYGAKALGEVSVAVGGGAEALGSTSFSQGYFSQAIGSYSVAMGYFTRGFNTGSTALGLQSLAYGRGSVSMGVSNYARAYGSTTVGLFNNSSDAGADVDSAVGTNRIFQIGNGTSDTTRSNVLTALQNGNVGIGTVSPLARLHVADSSVLFSATGDVPATPVYLPPVSDAGRRLMWYPEKAAFRAGYVSGTQWNSNSIGKYSVAFGSNSTASGINSFVMGQNFASGNSATAFGIGNQATGIGSVAFGQSSQASNTNAFAAGFSAVASGLNSIAMGEQITAQGAYSIGLGKQLTLLSQGAIGIGKNNQSIGLETIVIGRNSLADGDGSIALGNSVYSGGSSSIALCAQNDATGSSSLATGNSTLAQGIASASFNRNTIARAAASSAMGYYNISKDHGGLVAGTYNDTTSTGSATAINSNNRIFQVGNGTADNARSNAMTVLQNGNVGIGVLDPDKQLSVATSMNVDENNSNNGTTANALLFGSNSGEAIASKRTAGGNQYGLDFYTNFTTKISISNAGNVGIGTTAPVVPLQFANVAGNKISFFQNGSNHYGMGTQASLLQVFTPTSADDIAFGYGNSGAFTENVRMDGSGSLAVRTNLTVQNGKGIIRNTDGTQSKKLSTAATINATFTAGQTQTFSLTWSEAFSAIPEAYVSNCTGAGGWAEVVMSIANVTTTGATLYVYNPKTVSASPNFTVRVVAIGAQ